MMMGVGMGRSQMESFAVRKQTRMVRRFLVKHRELNEEAASKHPKSDHWLRHYVGTLTNVRPQDSMVYYHP